MEVVIACAGPGVIRLHSLKRVRNLTVEDARNEAIKINEAADQAARMRDGWEPVCKPFETQMIQQSAPEPIDEQLELFEWPGRAPADLPGAF